MIAIIAVLIAPLLPAVQSAREAARRARCVNDLEQIGLALRNGHSTNDQFPLGASSGRRNPGQSYAKQNFTPHVGMLPFLEQGASYNAINVSFGREDDTGHHAFTVNATATRAKVSAFCGPSDPAAGIPDHNNDPNTNSDHGGIGVTTNLYNTNTGIGPNLTGTGAPPESTGLFTWQKSYNIASVIDGTSNTIAFAEAVVGTQSLQKGQKRLEMTSVTGVPAGAIALDPRVNGIGTVRSAAAACNAAWTNQSDSLDTQRGENRAHGCQGMTLFNTIAPPNLFRNEWANRSIPGSGTVSNFSNSDSWHPGGVDACMADGSVKFIKRSVNVVTWYALGTRGGGEVASADND